MAELICGDIELKDIWYVFIYNGNVYLNENKYFPLTEESINVTVRGKIKNIIIGDLKLTKRRTIIYNRQPINEERYCLIGREGGINAIRKDLIINGDLTVLDIDRAGTVNLSISDNPEHFKEEERTEKFRQISNSNKGDFSIEIIDV